jgi:hypothetical protein
MLGMLKDGEGYCGLLEDSIDSKVLAFKFIKSLAL